MIIQRIFLNMPPTIALVSNPRCGLDPQSLKLEMTTLSGTEQKLPSKIRKRQSVCSQIALTWTERQPTCATWQRHYRADSFRHRLRLV